VGTALSAIPASSYSKIFKSNQRINIGVVGLRGKGAQHIRLFNELPDVNVTAICDADESILNREAEKLDLQHEKVKAYIDFRKCLDDKGIDAIVIASPNHWHALMAIWACQAKKDVYVEKPVSHNVWEGRKIVEAARKYKRIVQTGTQSRSDEALKEVFAYLQEGNLGKILWANGLCYKRRTSIGLVNGPQPIPNTVNYNLWCGPSPLKPLRRQRLHYDWHWVWDTGNGDIGNQGVHEMDMCRWALQQNKLPKRVFSFGGRFGYHDDGNTPNTQITILDYEPAPIIFEVRGLPRKKDDTAMDDLHGVRIGLVVRCEDGFFAGGAGGGWIYDKKGNKIKQFSSPGGGGHQANFIKALKSRKQSDLHADIQEGHLSSSLCHLGNISYRLGHLSSSADVQKSAAMQQKSLDAINRLQDHLFANWIDIEKNKITAGPWLNFDPAEEKFTAKDEYGIHRWANDLLKGSYRNPFIVPEKI
jgi:predicted dehydrogenase